MLQNYVLPAASTMTTPVTTKTPPLSFTNLNVRTVSSGELLQGRSEVLIQHGDSVYRLRQTRTGKLLLYK